MKSYIFRLTILLILTFAVAHLTSAEYCPTENCLPEEQCSAKVKNGNCANGNACCSIVKANYRTHCRHFLGACMNKCNDKVWIREAVDCANNQRCCILL